MKRLIRAKSDINEAIILTLLEDAQKAISRVCEDRNKDEYIDDVKWGKDRFEIPVFVEHEPGHNQNEIAKFKFIYDPDDEDDLSIEEQMQMKLDEFIEDWNYEEDDSDEEMTHEDFIESAISDETYECYKKYQHDSSLTMSDICAIIKKNIENPPYNLVEDEDFTEGDIFSEMDEYFWDAE